MTELRTARLALRQWLPADEAPFAALNADPQVMEFLAAPLSRAHSDALARDCAAALARHGFGVWAVALRESNEFLGCVGLAMRTFTAPFTPCVEILWRLRRESWGQGYASEAARECLRCAFEDLGLLAVVSFTVPANRRSLALMERLGLQRDPTGDFEHPRLPPGHALRHHQLYRLGFRAWQAVRP